MYLALTLKNPIKKSSRRARSIKLSHKNVENIVITELLTLGTHCVWLAIHGT
ncbi:MAG: hypothetical protein ACI9T7_003432, partial [Oleiphilaceae bacterium]